MWHRLNLLDLMVGVGAVGLMLGAPCLTLHAEPSLPAFVGASTLAGLGLAWIAFSASEPRLAAVVRRVEPARRGDWVSVGLYLALFCLVMIPSVFYAIVMLSMILSVLVRPLSPPLA